GLDEGETSASSGEETSGETGEEGPPNLAANPGFETNTTGWQPWGGATLTRSNLQAHSGSYAGLVANRTMNWESAVYSILDIVEPGESYDISIWARLSGTAASASQLTVNTTCAGEAAGFTQIASQALVDTEWRQLSGTYVVPDDCTLEALNVYVDNVAVGASYFIDDLSVTLRPPPVNLIANPDFEVDASGWFGFGSAA